MKKSVLVGFGALTIMALLMAPLGALAAEWDMYGSARVNFFYLDLDKEANDGINSDYDLDMGLQSNSRIGANVKVSDEVSGRFEFGASSANVGTRLIYGDWTFGPGTLRVGQDYTPISGATSNQVFWVDDNLNAVGAVDEDRLPQIKLIMGGLQVALIENRGSASDSFTTNGYTETDIVIPKIEVSYEFATDTISIMPFAGYQSYDAETAGAGQTSEAITSYLLGVHGRVSLGPAYVNFSGHYAQNGGDYGLFSLGQTTSAQLVGTNVEDSTGYGCALVVGFKASDTLQLEAGVGYVTSEVDTDINVTTEDDTIAYYANAVVTLAPGVYIIPEIGVYDYGDLKETGLADQKEGQLLYYGAKFQIDF